MEKRYTDIVDENGEVVLKGKRQRVDNSSQREVLGIEFLDGNQEVVVEKFRYIVCGYSKIKEYRRLEGGYRPYYITRYRYIYYEGGKRLTSRDFKSLSDLIKDNKERTSNVKMGINTEEVPETEYLPIR